jgi:polar amino acid transport system substrate-binding protein
MLLSFSAVFALCVGCGKPKPVVVPASNEPPKPLVMVTEAGFPPYEYIENGEVVGVDIDICRTIADRLGRPLVVVSTNFDAIARAIVNGDADLAAAGLTITAERKEILDFSMPYATSGIVFISKKGAEYKDIASAKGKRIGVQSGTTSDHFCMEELEVVPQRFDNPGLAAEALKAGKVDMIIVDIDPARNIAGNDASLVISSETLCMEELAIAVKKGNGELLASINETLDSMLHNGKVYASLAKHVAHLAYDFKPAATPAEAAAAEAAAKAAAESAAETPAEK